MAWRWILCIFALVLHAHAASTERGVWFWQSGGIYGSNYIIADPLLRTQTIGWLQYQGIDRVYGSYGAFPGTANEANVIAWNAELDAAGIQSHLLLDGPDPLLDDPITPTAALLSLLNKITSRFVDYNASRADPAERFDAIHLDIEPQQLDDWDLYPDPGDLPLRLENRRQLYYDLRNVFQAIRNHLVGLGAGATEVNADLNDWVDKLPSSTRFQWETATDREQYYADLAAELDGITLMSYELPTYSQISNRVNWEVTNVTGMFVRIALDADIGAGETWPTTPAFWSMADMIETDFGSDRGIDIHSYSRIRSKYVLATVDGLTSGSGGIGVGVTPILGTATFVGEKSLNLGDWQSAGVDHVGRGGVPLNFPAEGQRRYFRVGEYGEDAPYKLSTGPYQPAAPQTNLTHHSGRMTYSVYAPDTGQHPGPFPLVVYSADSGQPSNVIQIPFQDLTPWGYIGLAVSHDPKVESNRLARAEDLLAIMDDLARGRIVPLQLGGHIATNRIAVVGQGQGSTTALKLCGLRFFERGQSGATVQLPATHIKAVVALSPRIPGTDGLDASSWQGISKPVMVISGSNDTTATIPTASDRQAVFPRLPHGRKHQLWLEGADHADFTDAGIAANGATYYQWYAQAILAFLDAELHDDQGAALWLRAQTINRLSQRMHQADWK